MIILLIVSLDWRYYSLRYSRYIVYCPVDQGGRRSEEDHQDRAEAALEFQAEEDAGSQGRVEDPGSWLPSVCAFFSPIFIFIIFWKFKYC